MKRQPQFTPRHRKTHLILSFILGYTTMHDLSAMQYEVISGKVSAFHVNPRTKEEIYAGTKTFIAYIGAAEWRLDSINEPPQRKRTITYGDGENIYVRFEDAEYVPSTIELEGVQAGHITGGNMPYESDPWTLAPWFMLIGGNAAAQESDTTLIPTPWGLSRDNILDLANDVEITFLDNQSRFVAEAQFVHSKELANLAMESDVLNETDTDVIAATAARIQEKEVTGKAVTTTTTNLFDKVYPKTFLIEKFSPNYLNNISEQNHAAIRYKGTIASITRTNTTTSLGVIPSGVEISVMDTRLREVQGGIEGFSYRISDRSWPIEPPTSARERFAIASSTWLQIVMRGVMWIHPAVFMAIPAYFVFRTILYTRKTTKQ